MRVMAHKQRPEAGSKRPKKSGRNPGPRFAPKSKPNANAADAPHDGGGAQSPAETARKKPAARKKPLFRKKPRLTARDVMGLKYFTLINPLLERLHDCATERDVAGNRILHFDQYCSLVLLFYFNPIVDSLRGIQQASELVKIQRNLGCSRASLGSLSEAARVFDAELLRNLIPELAAKVLPTARGKDAEALRGLIAVDGSLLPALPKMVWALWLDENHRAAKLHLHLDVFKGVPEEATFTHGSGSERQQLRETLQPNRIYVVDRGYEDYQLFQDILDARSSFIARLQDSVAYKVLEERPITDEARAAGVISDEIVKRLGTDHHKRVIQQLVRIVKVKTEKLDSDGQPNVLVLVTDLLNLPAELVALGYKHRWAVELFFRWLKCILGCRHLLANNLNGVEIQVYLGIIASLLISLWTGRKPTKRTLEMVQFYFTGMASWEELQAHIERLKNHE
jgi:Transposase DDE domain